MASWETGTYETIILEGHLDSFGHVNNAVYLELLEAARWDLLTKGGYGYEKVQELKVGPTILEVTVQFLHELRLRDRITIETRMISYEGKIGTLEQDIKSADGKTIHCHSVFKFGLFDVKSRRLILPTPEWLAAIGKRDA